MKHHYLYGMLMLSMYTPIVPATPFTALNFWVTQHMLKHSTQELSILIDFPESPPTTASFSSDNHWLVVGGRYGSLYLYEMDDAIPHLLRSWHTSEQEPVEWIHFDTTGNYFVTATAHVITMITIDQPNPIASLTHKNSIQHGHLYNGEVIFSSSWCFSTDIWKWNLSTLSLIKIASLPDYSLACDLSLSEHHMMQLHYGPEKNSVISFFDLAGNHKKSFIAPPHRHVMHCFNNRFIITAGGLEYPHQHESIECWDWNGNLLKQVKTPAISYLYHDTTASCLLSVDSEAMQYSMWDVETMQELLRLHYFREKPLGCNQQLTMLVSRPWFLANGFQGFRLTRLIADDMILFMQSANSAQLLLLHDAYHALIQRDQLFDLYDCARAPIAKTLPSTLQDTINYVLTHGPLAIVLHHK